MRSRKNISWRQRFMDLANHIGEWSKDPSRGVGCVIVDEATKRVLSIGYNDFPQGVNDNATGRREKPMKYNYTEHAERNAIYSASRFGININGATMYAAWFPCHECGRAIIQSGIKKLVTYEPEFDNDTYGESFQISLEMMSEAGVEIIYLDNEKEFDPYLIHTKDIPGISIRTANKLIAADFLSLGAIINMNPEIDWSKYRGFGKRTVDEIGEIVKKYVYDS